MRLGLLAWVKRPGGPFAPAVHPALGGLAGLHQLLAAARQRLDDDFIQPGERVSAEGDSRKHGRDHALDDHGQP